GGSPGPQPQRPRGLGFDAAPTADAVRIPPQRRGQPPEAGIVLRTGAGAGRRRSYDGGTRVSLRHAGEPRQTAAAARNAGAAATRDRRRSADAESGGELYHAR